jgi:type II secretory pathway component PulF
MPDFAYIARDTKGERVTGVLSATSHREVINVLSGRSLFPVEVTQKKDVTPPNLNGRVRPQEMATFYTQMSGLLRSGVPMMRSLKILSHQSANKRLSAVVKEVESRVEDGESLGEAMSRFPRVFNEMAVNMAKAGGEGGFLEDALDRVATFTELQADLRARTVGAMIYPFVLGTIGTAVVSALIIFFVPKFGQLFDQLREKGELPIFTDWLLQFSEFLQGYWYLIVGAFAILFIVLRVQLSSEKGLRRADFVKIRAPLFGEIYRSLAIARFCRVLGTLLKNGVPILKSLEISRNAAGNRVLSEAIEKASENVTAGESLAVPLQRSGHFPLNVVEMISVAEESNSLDTVLVEIADGLEKRSTRRLDLVVRMIEPAMLLVMACVVLFVVIALLLPVLKLSSLLQN